MDIISPIAKVLGLILDFLFKGMNAIGVGNIALAIVLFTLIVKLLMLPLTVKQQKMSKLQVLISPEINAIREKYQGKSNDSAAMAKMQAETKAVYDKYGVSQWGSCVQLLIQMPILFALYRVFQKIPLYISQIKDLYLNIIKGTGDVAGISSVDGYADILNEIYGKNVDWNNVDTAVTTLNSFTSGQWDLLRERFADLAPMITENYDKISHVNTFLGVNMSQNPTFGLGLSVLIPILAGLSQFISVKISQSSMEMDDDNPAAASMKMMTYFMPLMSLFIAFSVPAGLGVYWIATAVFQTIMYVCINKYYDSIGTDEIIRRNVEKLNKKREKQGLPAQTIVKGASVNTKNVNKESTEDRIKRLQEKKEENDRRIKELKEAANNYKSAKPGSLAEKAGMVAKYNEMNEKKK